MSLEASGELDGAGRLGDDESLRVDGYGGHLRSPVASALLRSLLQSPASPGDNGAERGGGAPDDALHAGGALSAPPTPAAHLAPPPAAEVEVVEGRDDPLRAARQSSLSSSVDELGLPPYAPAPADAPLHLARDTTPVLTPIKAVDDGVTRGGPPAANPTDATTDMW